MNRFFRWLLRRTPDGKKRCGWDNHTWKEDIELSSAGLNAVIAGMWWPPATCTKCEETKEPINLQYAEKNGWLKKKRETPQSE